MNPFEKSSDKHVQILFTGNYADRISQASDPYQICTFCKETTAIWFKISGVAIACGECALNASKDTVAVKEFDRLGGKPLIGQTTLSS